MPEILDTFDKYGNKTGVIQKGQNTNDFVMCCSCFVINSKKQVLIEKRGNTVLDPGKLDLCSGHVQAGELPIQGMARELNEELGIDENESRNLKKLGRVLLDFKKIGGDFRCITDVFLLRRNKETLELQDEEVKGIEYYDLKDVINLIRNGQTRLPYDKENSNYFEEIFKKLEEELGIKTKKENKNIMEK